MNSLQAHLCVFPSPQKTLLKNRSRSGFLFVNSPEKSYVPSPEAVGEGDERVISLQSRIALVDQFANAPQPHEKRVGCVSFNDGYITPEGTEGVYIMETDEEV